MLLSIGLLLIGLIAIIVEFFVPAMGLVGILGAGSIVGSVVLVFIQKGTMLGSIFLIVVLIIVPFFIAVCFKIFPHTFMGKRLILGNVQKREGGYASYSSERYIDLNGKMGTTLTVLRPSGIVLIEKKKYSVVTAGEYIDKGHKVRVVKIEGSRIIVREAQGG